MTLNIHDKNDIFWTGIECNHSSYELGDTMKNDDKHHITTNPKLWSLLTFILING